VNSRAVLPVSPDGVFLCRFNQRLEGLRGTAQDVEYLDRERKRDIQGKVSLCCFIIYCNSKSSY
jgi:hypothetical protein